MERTHLLIGFKHLCVVRTVWNLGRPVYRLHFIVIALGILLEDMQRTRSRPRVL